MDKLIACEVLRSETEHILGECEFEYDVAWLEQGLHDEPDRLRAALQDAVDACTGQGFGRILLLYALCSNATEGLTARDTPLVIPRAHDCITFYLGSRARYQHEHESAPGTYWFSRGFLHREQPEGTIRGFGGASQHVGSGMTREAIYREFVETYGEDEADYLMETLIDSWKKNYTRAVLVTWDYPEVETDRAYVKDLAAENDWTYEEMPADLGPVRDLLTQRWNDEEFLLVPPGHAIAATHDDAIISCRRCLP